MSKRMRRSRERRRYRRAHCDFPVQFRSFGQGVPAMGGFTRDIAEGGVRFVAHRFIPVATNLTFDMKLSTTRRPLKATSKVAWVRRLPDGDRYEIGLEFNDISDDDKREIRTVTYPE